MTSNPNPNPEPGVEMYAEHLRWLEGEAATAAAQADEAEQVAQSMAQTARQARARANLLQSRADTLRNDMKRGLHTFNTSDDEASE